MSLDDKRPFYSCVRGDSRRCLPCSLQFSEASGLYDCCSAAHNGGGAALLHLHTWTFSAALCLVCLPSVGCCMCFRLVRGGRRTAARSTAVRWQATPHNLCCCPLVFVPAHITAASIEGRLDTPVVGVETQKATPCCLWAWVPQHLAAMWCAALTPSRPLPSQAAPPLPPRCTASYGSHHPHCTH